MPNYFITGGCGFIGSHFNEAIDSYPVVNYDILPPSVETDSKYVEGDIFDIPSMQKAMSGSDIIIHLAATHFDFQVNYHKTNVDGTRAVIEAAEGCGIKTIVFYSSVAVYGKITKPTSDNGKPNPNMSYGESKLMAEELLVDWQKKEANRCLIIIRPTVVYGPRNFGNVFNLIKQIDSGVYFHIGSGTNVKSITYVKNLISNTLQILEKASPGIQILNNVDEPQMNTKDLANTIADILGKSIKLTLPKTLALILALPFDILNSLFKMNTPVSRERIMKFTSSTHFLRENLNKAGVKNQIEPVDAISETIAWYKDVDWKSMYDQWRSRVEKYS